MTARSFISFYLNDQLYGLDILLVREINRYLNITPIPLAASYIQGLMNLRGQVVTIINLKQRLRIPPDPSVCDIHNIILKTDNELAGCSQQTGLNELFALPDKVGLLVDAIGDVITVNSKEIDPTPANVMEVDSAFLKGVVKLEDTLMTVLDIKAILEHE